MLLQNAGRQALVVNAVASLQARHPTLASARRSRAYGRELGRVAANIVTMPLWKLQRIGGDSDEFLYRRSELADRSIRLLPGVPAAFRTLHGLVLDAVFRCMGPADCADQGESPVARACGSRVLPFRC